MVTLDSSHEFVILPTHFLIASIHGVPDVTDLGIKNGNDIVETIDVTQKEWSNIQGNTAELRWLLKTVRIGLRRCAGQI